MGRDDLVPLPRLHQLTLKVTRPSEAALARLGGLVGGVAVQLRSFGFVGGAGLLMRWLGALRGRRAPLQELTPECVDSAEVLDPALLVSFLAACSPELSAGRLTRVAF